MDLRLSPTPTGSARIASAIDSSLVQAVRAAFPRPPERSSCRPTYLMSAFNRWRKDIKASARGFCSSSRSAPVSPARRRTVVGGAQRRGTFDEPRQWAGCSIASGIGSAETRL